MVGCRRLPSANKCRWGRESSAAGTCSERVAAAVVVSLLWGVPGSWLPAAGLFSSGVEGEGAVGMLFSSGMVGGSLWVTRLSPVLVHSAGGSCRRSGTAPPCRLGQSPVPGEGEGSDPLVSPGVCCLPSCCSWCGGHQLHGVRCSLCVASFRWGDVGRHCFLDHVAGRRCWFASRRTGPDDCWVALVPCRTRSYRPVCRRG